MNFFLSSLTLAIRTIHTIIKVAGRNSRMNELEMDLSLSTTQAVVWRYSSKIVVKTFAKFIGEHACRCLFVNKVAAWKSLQLKYFPVNFEKFLRTTIL